MKVELGKIYNISSGGTPSKKCNDYYDGGKIKWVKTGDLKEKYLYDTDEYITENGLRNSSAKLYQSDTVLIAMYGATIGATAILRTEACTNQACAAFVKNDRVIPEYLYYFFKSQKDKFTKDGVGGAQPNISIGYLRNVRINLISIDEQEKIAENLGKIEELICNEQAQIRQFDILIKSRFVEMFGDLKKNDMGWQVCSFSDFAQIDTTMIHDFEKYGDYPHIGIDSIEKESGNISGYRTVREDGVVSGKYLFTPEHIIYSKIRPNLNKVALPEFKGVCSADAYPILPKKERCNRIFLAYTMRSSIFLEYILAFSSRTNLPKVNKLQVEGFCCPIPDIALQEQFASFVHQVDRLKFTTQKSLEKTQLLFNSLMQQYFG